jgi:hypothetical protein
LAKTTRSTPSPEPATRSRLSTLSKLSPRFLALLLLACAGVPVRPEQPLPVAASPAEILDCDPASAPITSHGGEAYICGGLRVVERCERRTALFYGVVNELVCDRRSDAARHEDNMALTARALFWRDTLCTLPASRAGRDDALAPVRPAEGNGRVRLVVEGCGQQRRYVCPEVGKDFEPPTALRCEPAPPEIGAYAAALADTRALFHQATGCPLGSIVPATRSRGPLPEQGVTEVILDGCGQQIPFTCALEPPPHVKHGGACAAQQPMPEALADAEAQATRAYAAASGCERLGARPRLVRQPVTLGRDVGFEQVFHAEGCAARGRVRCTGHGLRDRRMACAVERSPLEEDKIRPGALAAARQLHPGCAFASATKWGGGDLYAYMTVTGTCGEEPTVAELVCDADPATQRPRCDTNPDRERVGTEGRAFALAHYAQATGCPAERTRLVENHTDFVNGCYRRTFRVTGCKDSVQYACIEGHTADGAPACGPMH